MKSAKEQKERNVVPTSAPADLPLALDLEPGRTEAVLGLAPARIGRRLEAGKARANDAPAVLARDVADVREGRAVLASCIALERGDATAA